MGRKSENEHENKHENEHENEHENKHEIRNEKMNSSDIRKGRPVVYTKAEIFYETAEQLAQKLGTEVIYDEAAAAQVDWMLCLDENGISLTDGQMVLRGDFTSMLPRLKLSNLNGELLVKASKWKGEKEHPVAVDATAGMGEDSLLLAAAGYHVELYEYDPVIAALLRDTLRRAREIPELSEIVSRMELKEEDSMAALSERKEAPEVVYLDPMFPKRQKSGLIKKKFQLLQQLERPCTEEEALMEAALKAKPHRIIVKRPRKGPYLAGRKPDYSCPGKAIRYDCYLFPNHF